MSVINDLRERLMRKKNGPSTLVKGSSVAMAKPAATAVQRVPPPLAAPRGDLEGERKNLEKLLGEIDSRFGKQAAETERLIQPIQGLPHAVEAITEVKTQCGRMLELISAQAEGQRDHGQELDANVDRLRDASSQQAELLQGIRQQVEMNTQAIKLSVETYEAVIGQVGEVHKACCKLQESLADVARAGEGSTSEVAKALARHERTMKRSMKMVAIGAAAAAVVAIAIAIIGLL